MGTLISEQHILTAAHCFWDVYGDLELDPKEFVVRLGSQDINSTDINILIEKIHFNNFNNNNYHNDIAILELKENVVVI